MSSSRFRPAVCMFGLAVFLFMGCSNSKSHADDLQPALSTTPLWGDYPNDRPSCVKGIHLTAWVVGSKKLRTAYEKLFEETELNTAVIDIKEIEGEVYVPGVTLDGKNVSVTAIKDFKEYLSFLKNRGVYTIARMTVFKDQKLAKLKPEWAIKSVPPTPKAIEMKLNADVWVDKKGRAWADPTNHHVWDYNISIAEKAAALGFQGIQFDYIRFPSDGPTLRCRYSKPHTHESAAKTLAEFLAEARRRLKPLGVEISIDVFGLVGSYDNDLNIGQKLTVIIDDVDAVCPMMYPSHYAPGEYGFHSPNNMPYDTVYRSIGDTLKTTRKRAVTLRPYLQDFSLGVKYTAKHVRDQIQAANDHGVYEWILWNPSCKYTRDAFLPDPAFRKK